MPDTPETFVPLKSLQNFPIVGVGASAGGLDAFKRFIEAIPPDSGMAYVLVQHLAPDHESLLPNILSNFTDLTVHEIADDIALVPNSIYVIPENKMLTTTDGVLKLTPRDMSTKKNMLIDVFLKSLAEVHKSFAVGIILSGTGFDGAIGLKTIREFGGVTYAQQPQTAAFDGMPQNAINAGAIDFILPPEEIPQHLQHINHAYQTSNAYADDLTLSKKEDDIFNQILRILRTRTGNDFSHYKQPTLRRRIARRMVMTKNENPDKYLKYLRAEKDEQDALFNDILISVSYFFRDPKTFDTLCQMVLPLLIKNRAPNDVIRCWVAGCSTGEEAYSLAICLHEHLHEKWPNIKVQIFASDISENVIAKARAATYTKQELQNISEKRLQHYFTKVDGNFHVNKAIRDMVVFAVHNFTTDPPFARMDLVSCRNVLIYLDPFLQKKAISTFHYALKEQGVLFLGKSETISNTELFDPLIKLHKIFTKKATSARFFPTTFEPLEISLSSTTPVTRKKVINEPDFHKLAYDIIFNKYTPAGVIINENRDIVHFHGDTGPFLLSSPGKPNFNVLKMARQGLEFELRNTLLKVKNSEEPAASKKVPVKGVSYLVSFDVIPLLTNTEQHYLVLFNKIEAPPEDKENAKVKKNTDQDRIKQLEAELAQLRDDIRRVNEDQEAAHEELQSANEELLSNSEELQSLNEELETSAEELQSNNEELTSLNDELLDRQQQLMALRQHAEAIVETIHEPLLIIDSKMHIKSANASFYKHFDTKGEDVEGRLLFEINKGQWNNPGLRKLLQDVLPYKTKIEDFELKLEFKHLGERTIVINAKQIINEKNIEPQILLAFEDITESRILKLLKESESRFRIIADSAPAMIWMSGTDKMFSFFNKCWIDFTGKAIGKTTDWTNDIHPDDVKKFTAIYNAHFDAKTPFNTEFRLKRHDGQYRWLSVNGVPRFSVDGEFLGFVGACMDIHEQKDFSEALEGKVQQHTKELRDSEAFLQSVLNTTQNLIYIYDLEKKKIIFINKKSFVATGFTAEEMINGENDIFSEQIHSDDIEKMEKHRREILKIPDGKMATIEFRLKNDNDGWTYQLSRDLVFKRNSKGKVTQYVGVSTDITDIKNANEQLISKNEELEHSNIELASFSSIASHDLKEPLRKIQMFSKLIIEKDKENVSETSQAYLDRIIVSANRMQQLIDDLISYSRNNSENVKLVNTDMNTLLAQVLEDIKEVVAEKGAAIEFEDLPHIPVLASQFRQLFQNLISNAIKYSRKDVAPYITIKQGTATDEEIMALNGNPELGYCKFVVKDNGIGFSPEYKNKIFEPFQRLHGKDEYSGTGIGLAICKKIMVNHNGFITAESEPGKGATFNIYIKRCR